MESREAVRWRRELVGTVYLSCFAHAGHLRDELACLLFQAVVGTSRLPLTSIESPLPDFSLGRLLYLYRPRGSSPLAPARELRAACDDVSMSVTERVKLFEFVIRTSPKEELGEVAGWFGQNESADPPALFGEMFNSASLSPYTDFAPKALALLGALVRRGTIKEEARADSLARLVRQLGRHLTAYDLVTFHHRGANYPDGLLLDNLLGELLDVFSARPDLFLGDTPGARLRRRAVRTALLFRLAYTGHPVPDAPTSPGENLRVMPPPYFPVPEDQIYSPTARTRRLFIDELSLDSRLIRAVFADLDEPAEMQELGTALFLDRPFGVGKAAGEPDQTLLASHVLFSRSIAEERLRLLGRKPDWLPDPGALIRWRNKVRGLAVSGVPLPNLDSTMRPGVVSLADAWRVVGDWIMMRTTRQTVCDLARQFDLHPLNESGLLPVERWRVMAVGVAPGSIRVFDDRLQARIEISADPSAGYAVRGGTEMPAAGLVVLNAWTADGQPIPATAGRRVNAVL
jgi:hypothetical protein